jgi:hypothetical protein
MTMEERSRDHILLRNSGLEVEEEFRQHFLLTGIATGPATSAQVDALEVLLGHPLPATYRAYLRVCGTRPPRSQIGSQCVIDDVPHNIEAAQEIIAEDHSQNGFPSKFVVFLMHQGYAFMFFPVDGSDDPPVYFYCEGDGMPKQSAEKFSHWVFGLRTP